jgi:DNA-binding CsgD family transcriptional regulator
MDITFPEIGQDGYNRIKGELTQYMKEQFPSLYQTEVKIADRTEESENTIKILVNQADNVLHNTDGGQTMREYALDLGISQYTITWYTIDGKHSKYGVTVKAREE